MAGARTAGLGRILATLGWIWILGAIVTAFVGDVGAIPFLPGVGIYIGGKIMSALGKRGAEEEAGATEQQTASIEPTPPREPRRVERPVSERNEYLGERRGPETEPEEKFEIPDLEEAILEAPPPMSSEEMVAEARRRFGPKPLEEND